jgi:hypothetical protein
MVPRENPCGGYSYDVNEPDDPWHNNRLITANFNGFTGWKNNRNGAIAEKVGDVRFNNFKVADNKLAGIEFSLTVGGNEMARVSNALIVGRTNNSDEVLEASTPRGIIAPRTDQFLIEGARFFNWDWGDAAAFGSCSHCFHAAATDSGARTITVRNITLDDSVTRIFNYGYPERAIFYDEDGTTTGKGPGSWATFYYAHHNVPECEYNFTYYGGVFCDSSIQIRRVAFANSVPADLFRGMYFYILPYDDHLFLENGGDINRTEYLLDKNNYGSMEFRFKLDPRNGWATPMVTGHKYKIHWGTGLDFEEMQLLMSE